MIQLGQVRANHDSNADTYFEANVIINYEANDVTNNEDNSDTNCEANTINIIRNGNGGAHPIPNCTSQQLNCCT